MSREELRQATEKRVLAAADRLFREHGFDSTTIREIAKQSDVSLGTVMAVGDKNMLLVRVFDALIEEQHSTQTIPSAANTASCSERIMTLVQPFVSLFTSRDNLARSYASIVVSGDQPSTLFTSLAGLLIDEIHSVILEHGCVADDKVASTAKALYFAYVGTLLSWSSRAAVDEKELSENLQSTFDVICPCKKKREP